MRRLLPGLGLTLLIGALAFGTAALETRLLGQPVIEGLVVAILLGILVRSATTLPASLDAGIDVAGKQLLELAIVLLGASVDLPLLLRAGPALAIGIVLLVIGPRGWIGAQPWFDRTE